MAKRLKAKALEEFKRKVKLRPFEQKDADQCNALYNLVFKQNRSMQQWRWLYEDRPRGGHNTFVAELGDEIIGQYSTVLTKYKLGEKEVMASDHIDAVMKSEYRGTGLYSKMGNMQHESFEHELGMGFPTPLYYRFGSKTLGYEGVGKVPRWLKILRSDLIMESLIPTQTLGKLAGILSKPATRLLFRSKERVNLDRFRFQKVEAFDQRVDALWERVKGDRPIMAVRDSAFLNWRFQKSPFHKFDLFLLLKDREALGYVVCMVEAMKKGRRGFLADLLVVRDPDVEKMALSHAIEYFRKSGADYIICLMLDRYYMEHLKGFGFIRVPTKAFLAFKNFSPDDISTEGLCNPQNWYISAADSDWV